MAVFGLRLYLFMVDFFFSVAHSGFKGEASERSRHPALGPAFKGTCSLNCVFEKPSERREDLLPPIKGTVRSKGIYTPVGEQSFEGLKCVKHVMSMGTSLVPLSYLFPQYTAWACAGEAEKGQYSL